MLGKFLRKLRQATGINVSKGMHSAKRIADTAGNAIDAASMSGLARGVSSLNIDWQNGGQSYDDGSGRVLRNWDVTTPSAARAQELFLTWESANSQIDHYIIFIGWKGWANECLMKKGQHFSPKYVQAFVTNQLGTVRHLRVEAEQVKQHCLILRQDPEADDFYYLKLVGVDSDGNCCDIPGAVLASSDRRKSQNLAPAPPGDHPSFPVPADGGREQNQLERELIEQAQR